MIKKQAPFAHVSRFGLCTNGVQNGVGSVSSLQAQFGTAGICGRPAMKTERRLLRNVYLFLFVNVAQKVNQTTDKRDCSEAERDPS